MNPGLLATVAAFLIWGLLPLYLKPLHAVPATQIMAHRLVWCCVMVLGWLTARGELRSVRLALALPRTRWRLCASALLIATNWLVYVSGVNNGHVIETSLGYFINPLVNVVLGVLLLGERLNSAQRLAVLLAAAAVVYLTWLAGRPPWIALALALSFGAYGLIRKTAAVEALPGLAAETALIAPLGVVFLVWEQWHGRGAFGQLGLTVDGLLLAGGIVTAVPLALFSFGARRIPYSTVGLIQYLGPSMQLLLGVFLFHEPFSAARAAGFAIIWAALAIYAADGLLRVRRRRGLRADSLAST